MRGLAEHLGLLVLQQRGAAAALETDLLSLVREVTALQSLTKDYSAASTRSSRPFSVQDSESPSNEQEHERALPPQEPLRQALETERGGLRRGVEAVREVQLLLKSVVGSDPPTPPPASASPEDRLRRARGGEGWGEAPTDPVTAAEVKAAVDGLERSLSGMLVRVERYPSPVACATAPGIAVEEGSAGFVAPPLLAAGAARLVVETREALRARAEDARGISERFAGVLPRAALVRVAQHLADVDRGVGSVLDGSKLMRSWLLADADPARSNADSRQVDNDGVSSDVQQQAAAEHASRVGERLTDAVKAMLLSVQALCPRDTTASAATASTPDKGRAADGNDTSEPGKIKADDDSDHDREGDGWSTGTTLFEAHASAFEQARGLKLWRCASAMAAARLALQDLSEDEVVGASGRGAAGEAAAALVSLCGEVLVLAEQVLSAGKAVLVGMLALNKVRLLSCQGLLNEGCMVCLCDAFLLRPGV